MNQYLIIARVGDNSLHPEWLKEKSPNFDIFLSYFGDELNKYREQATYYEQVKGGKWPEIARIVNDNSDIMAKYDAIWMPDDDLLISTKEINRMFNFFNALELDLAQPSLSKNSYFSYSQLLNIPQNLIRYVNFVEVMAPIFSGSGLEQLKHTFSMSPSGWGLDSVWPKVIKNPNKRKIAILDVTQVIHTRPVGGELYKKNPNLSPQADVDALVESFAKLNINIDPCASINRFRVYAQTHTSEYKSDIKSRVVGKYQRKINKVLYKKAPKYSG